jgi:hypothetical protein
MGPRSEREPRVQPSANPLECVAGTARRTRRGCCRVLLTLLALTAGGVAAQESDYPELTSDEELRLAMSAGPLSVTTEADVYVMTPRGFERAVEGSNGFSCLVVRSAAQRGTIAPHCLNDAATSTVLPSLLREGELQARGMSAEAIAAEMNRQWASGELPLPSGPAYAYMLSSGQRLGAAGRFEPHFMLYVPYATNADIGGDPARQQFPFVGPFENHPLSTVVIVMEEFVDPASVPVPHVRSPW